MSPPAQAKEVSSQAAANYRYVYRVWIHRYNPYTHKAWWEIYTTTTDCDRAYRVSNALCDRGYSSYVDTVKSYY
jgi:hypothetical protein